MGKDDLFRIGDIHTWVRMVLSEKSSPKGDFLSSTMASHDSCDSFCHFYRIRLQVHPFSASTSPQLFTEPKKGVVGF